VEWIQLNEKKGTVADSFEHSIAWPGPVTGIKMVPSLLLPDFFGVFYSSGFGFRALFTNTVAIL
jgi:hypothetical protein